jgi:Mg2+-importing ATPase
MVGNFGNFFALAGLYLLSSALPLLPVQLLLTSLITDLPHIFIYSDNINNYQVRKPQLFNIHSLMFISLLLGSLTMFFEFIFFATTHLRVSNVTESSIFLFLTFIQLIVIFSIRNTDYFWKGKNPSFLLTISTVFVFLLAIVFVYVPSIAHLFSFTSLSFSTFSYILVITVVYFIALDIAKVWYYKMNIHAIKPVN